MSEMAVSLFRPSLRHSSSREAFFTSRLLSITCHVERDAEAVPQFTQGCHTNITVRATLGASPVTTSVHEPVPLPPTSTVSLLRQSNRVREQTAWQKDYLVSGISEDRKIM